MKTIRFFSLALPALVLISTHLAARDYYVSPDGDDSGPASLIRPWRTLEQVGSSTLRPGDRVLLEGGRVFHGTLRLEKGTAGSLEQPLLITSYGAGRAVIDGGDGPAVVLLGTRFIEIRELRLLGSGRKGGNTASGVEAVEVGNLVIDRIEVSGFQKSGVSVEGASEVVITRVHAHENGAAGISSEGSPSRNIYVGHCLAENNPGDPTNLTNHSGNGIVIGRVQGALIEYCEARYNGWDMPRKGNGPVGIWVWDADRAVIQYNISHHNRSTGIDGGGFDFDGGVTNSLLQYNYSHDNHGSGYLICQYWGAPPFRNNTVRYNISQDDGLTNHDAGIYVWVGGRDMESTDVYNNTVFNSKGSAVAFGVDSRYNGEMPVMTFRNNILVSGGDQVTGMLARARFEGNLYWAMGDGGFQIDGHRSLQDWSAATGQEAVGGNQIGTWADPLLRKEGSGLLTDPLGMASLTEYCLLPGSPAIDAGLDLGQFGIAPGARDFYGNEIPAGTRYDIGAHEFAGPESCPAAGGFLNRPALPSAP